MMNAARSLLLLGYGIGYALIRPAMFRTMSAQTAHERMLILLKWLDGRAFAPVLGGIRRATLPKQPVSVGGVTLDYPLILAAGFVKGAGFPDEATALAAVERGENIMPGWRSVARTVGLVEYGSFTRWPRLGNPGTVVWRDVKTQSTQNRVGLKNPGVKAAAAFLARHRDDLPAQFGINIAVSPGVDDPDQEQQDVLESIGAFIDQGIQPTWFTLNLSCPNTEDDPSGNQTEAKARRLGTAAVTYLREKTHGAIPLWVKVGPNLADAQYTALIRALDEAGVKAIVATNTLGQPSPDDATLAAGVGGGKLHLLAVEAAGLLMMEKVKQGYAIDVVGCGGALDGKSLHNYRAWGVQATQYFSALIYRGPLAAALLLHEG